MVYRKIHGTIIEIFVEEFLDTGIGSLSKKYSSQQIPLDKESINYCLMVAAWQYLQYPENLTKEIARILSRDGKIIIAFSNRAFWHKAPNIWTSSTEEERVKYVRKVLISNGFNEPKIIKKFTEPALNIFNFLNKDPFYCLIATRE